MAKDAWAFIVPLAALSAAFLAAYAYLNQTSLGVAGGVVLVLAAFIAYFFRDPERTPPDGDRLVVSGGDGWVVEAGPASPEVLMDGECLQVSVFLSVFDVHINRIPASGHVTHVEHRPGRFKLAFVPAASGENEQTVVRLETQSGPMVVKQIAGYVARRIVCRLSPEDAVSIGDRYGLIKFGSRIDHILPPNSEVRVNVGDRVRAGETVIGVLPQ